MKMVFVLLGFLGFFATTQHALAQQLVFGVVPYRGVSVDQLSTYRIRDILDGAITAYSDRLAEIDADYERAKASFHGPNDDIATELGEQMLLMSQRHERDIRQAPLYAVCYIQRYCDELCAATINGRVQPPNPRCR